MMTYSSKFTQAKDLQKEKYSAIRTSEDNTSKDGFLEKGQILYREELTFWQRYRTMILVQVGILSAWTLVMYFFAMQTRSLSIHGPDLIHCKFSNQCGDGMVGI